MFFEIWKNVKYVFSNIGPGDIVLVGDPAPPPSKKGKASNFMPTSIVAKRLHVSRYHLVRM